MAEQNCSVALYSQFPSDCCVVHLSCVCSEKAVLAGLRQQLLTASTTVMEPVSSPLIKYKVNPHNI
jgi:hypothetical protein